MHYPRSPAAQLGISHSCSVFKECVVRSGSISDFILNSGTTKHRPATAATKAAFSVHLSYDTMESLLAPYQNESALKVARDLDAKVEGLLETAGR